MATVLPRLSDPVVPAAAQLSGNQASGSCDGRLWSALLRPISLLGRASWEQLNPSSAGPPTTCCRAHACMHACPVRIFSLFFSFLFFSFFFFYFHFLNEALRWKLVGKGCRRTPNETARGRLPGLVHTVRGVAICPESQKQDTDNRGMKPNTVGASKRSLKHTGIPETQVFCAVLCAFETLCCLKMVVCFAASEKRLKQPVADPQSRQL
ncbi:hypothetical protein VTI28DRAFT_431 [Corynascus sepedonium]